MSVMHFFFFLTFTAIAREIIAICQYNIITKICPVGRTRASLYFIDSAQFKKEKMLK